MTNTRQARRNRRRNDSRDYIGFSVLLAFALVCAYVFYFVVTSYPHGVLDEATSVAWQSALGVSFFGSFGFTLLSLICLESRRV